MKYVCVETTFVDQIYHPGDTYEAVGDELKGNKCWKAVRGSKSQVSSDDSAADKSDRKSSE